MSFLFLFGCSAGPADADIQAAIMKAGESRHSPLRQLDKAMSANLLAEKQIGCSKDKEGAA